MKLKRIILLFVLALTVTTLAACTGEVGTTGPAGTTGTTGAQGPAGQTGETGATGEQGTTGMTGVQGIAGLDGVSIAHAEINDAGEMVITLSNATQLNLGVVVAEDGIDGIDGIDGMDALNIEVQVVEATGMLQWRLGDGEWMDLIVFSPPAPVVVTENLAGPIEFLALLTEVVDMPRQILTTEGIWTLSDDVILYNEDGDVEQLESEAVYDEFAANDYFADVVIVDGLVTELRIMLDDAELTLVDDAELVVMAATQAIITIDINSDVEDILAELEYSDGATLVVQAIETATSTFADYDGDAFDMDMYAYQVVVISEDEFVVSPYAIEFNQYLPDQARTLNSEEDDVAEVSGSVVEVKPNMMPADVLAELFSMDDDDLEFDLATIEIFNSEFEEKSGSVLYEGDIVVVTQADGSTEVYWFVFTMDSVSVKENGSITDVDGTDIYMAYGTLEADFLADLMPVDGRPQTYETNDDFDQVTVTAESGAEQTYDLVIDPSESTDIQLIDSDYFVAEVSNDDLMVTVAKGLTVARFEDAIEMVDGSTLAEVTMTRSGVTSGLNANTVLFTGDYVVITAEDGTTASYMVMANPVSDDTELLLISEYVEGDYVISVDGDIEVPFTYDGTNDVELEDIRMALTGDEDEEVLTARFQSLVFEWLEDGETEWVAVAFGDEDSSDLYDEDDEYRLVVTAQNGEDTEEYDINVNDENDNTDIAFDEFSMIDDDDTQEIIVELDGSQLVVRLYIGTNGVDTDASDIADLLEVSMFADFVLQMIEDGENFDDDAATFSGSDKFDFEADEEYRVLVTAENGDEEAYEIVAIEYDDDSYTLEEDQVVVVSDDDDDEVVVSSRVEYDLEDIAEVMETVEFAAITFNMWDDDDGDDDNGEWDLDVSDSMDFNDLDEDDYYVIVITTKDGDDRELDLVVEDDNDSTDLTLEEDLDAILEVDGDIIWVSDDATFEDLLAEIDADLDFQTITGFTNAEVELDDEDFLYDYFYIVIEAQDADTDSEIFTIMTKEANTDLVAGDYVIEVVVDDEDEEFEVFVTVSGTVITVEYLENDSELDFASVLAADVLAEILAAPQTGMFYNSEMLAKDSDTLFTGDYLEVTAENGDVELYTITVEEGH